MNDRARALHERWGTLSAELTEAMFVESMTTCEKCGRGGATHEVIFNTNSPAAVVCDDCYDALLTWSVSDTLENHERPRAV